VRLNGGGILNVTTEGWSEDAVYVKAVYLNGKRLRKPVITYDDIKDGADLHFAMSGKPARKAFAE
jgi:putative alpha-1,2-mannosidase